MAEKLPTVRQLTKRIKEYNNMDKDKAKEMAEYVHECMKKHEWFNR